MIVDECHYGATDRQAHDTYVNDCHLVLEDGSIHHGPWKDKTSAKGQPKLLEQPNFLTLLVSATPYCMLSCNSRIPHRLFVHDNVTDEQLQLCQLHRQDVFEKQGDQRLLARPDQHAPVQLSPELANKLLKNQVHTVCSR